MQGIILAAGMGIRISKHIKDGLKCMIEINGEKLIKRQIEALTNAGINRIIIVCGYKKEALQKYIADNFKDVEIEFVDNDDYKTTNNIYSLYLAKDFLKEEDTILVESDLVFDYSIINKLVEDKNKNVAAIAKYKVWMDGTVVTTNENKITAFFGKNSFNTKNIDKYYKTINIYKLSKQDCIDFFIPRMEEYINKNRINEFYEEAFKDLIKSDSIIMNAKIIENEKWYEIDNITDLEIAKCLFSNSIASYEKRYGGYWNFTNLIDFCYLENPKFPTNELLEKIKYFSKDLITKYPSGRSIENINASKIFNVIENEIIVGNGSAELIKSLGRYLSGKLILQIPVFNEYMTCFEKCEIIKNNVSKNDYIYGKNEIIKNMQKCDIIALVNPDNPTGNFINYNDMLEIISEANKSNKTIIVDESFIDFADKDKRYTLIDHTILQKYKNLIVIKSISKSYGVPGIRLGVLATGDKELLEKLKVDLPIWNVNSIAEYFLQIVGLYKKEYEEACNYVEEQRNEMYNSLKEIEYLKPYKSQANYIMCKLLKYDTKYIAEYLLNNYNILIKNLNNKEGFNNKNYIRLTIKSEEDNKYLLDALRNIEKYSVK